MKKHWRLAGGLIAAFVLIGTTWMIGTRWNESANHSIQLSNARWGQPITAQITNPRTTNVFKEAGERRAVANISFTDHTGEKRNIQRVMKWRLSRTTLVWQNTEGKLFVRGGEGEWTNDDPLSGPSQNRMMLMLIAFLVSVFLIVIGASLDHDKNKPPPLQVVEDIAA